jgi:hypothetical protein
MFLIVVSVMGHEMVGSGDEEEPMVQQKPTYDQRQTGKYNVNFNIKDVNIFTLEGDTVGGGIGDDLAYEDYGDYDYDNSHYTIHPIFGTLGATTKKPTTIADPADASEKPAQKPTASTSKPASGSVTTPKPQTTTAKPTPSHKPLNAQLIYILRPNQTAETIALDYQDSDQIPVEVIHGRRVPQKYRGGKPKRQYVRHPGYFRPKEGSIRYLSQNGGRTAERCREGEYRDRSGACRERRANGM